MSSNKIKFLIAGFVILSSFLYLAVSGFKSENLVYFLTVDEVVKRKVDSSLLRVQGQILEGSLKKKIDAMQIYFKILGKESSLPVTYTGVPPDLLENGFPVIAEGRMNSEGTLVAQNLMVACPSKFEEMKEKGELMPEDHLRLMEKALKRKSKEIPN